MPHLKAACTSVHDKHISALEQRAFFTNSTVQQSLRKHSKSMLTNSADNELFLHIQ